MSRTSASASSLRGAKRRSNPESHDELFPWPLDCFASLAMTGESAMPQHRHCEEQRDEAIQGRGQDSAQWMAMTTPASIVSVMAGLVPAIHVFSRRTPQDRGCPG